MLFPCQVVLRGGEGWTLDAMVALTLRSSRELRGQDPLCLGSSSLLWPAWYTDSWRAHCTEISFRKAPGKDGTVARVSHSSPLGLVFW